MRFCVFCGKEIPENAMFCPACGGKQPEQTVDSSPEIDENNDEDEEDNAALNLLSKVNFATTLSRKESIVPTSSQRNTKKIEKVQVAKKPEVLKKQEEIPVEKYSPSQEESSPENYESDDSDPDVIVVAVDDSDSDNDENDELQKMFDELDKMDETPVNNVPPILTELKDNVEKEQETKRETEKTVQEVTGNIPKEEKPLETSTVDKELSAKTKREKVTYHKRNLSEEDESEDEVVTQTMKKNSSLGYDNINDDLTADEKADLEKYKNYKKEDHHEMDDIDSEPETERGEGRKSNGRKKEARKNVDKEISKRKVNIVEHEAADKKDNVDPDYDGYYENVRPIDYDKQKDNSSLIKVVLTAAAFVGLASAVFYLLFTFFMK